MEVRIEFLADGFDRLQAVISEEIIQLFGDEIHPGENRRILAFRFGRGQTELEVIDDREQSLEER